VAKDADADLRYYAIWAIGRIGPEAQEAGPMVGAALKDPSVDVRRKAAWALGRIQRKPEAALPLLTAVLSDADLDVREAAADALGTYGKDAVPVVRQGLKDPSPEQRRLAVRAIALIGPAAADAAPDLAPLLDSRDPLRDEAGTALARIGKAAVPVLNAALQDDDLPMIEQTVTALGSGFVLLRLRADPTAWQDPAERRRVALDAFSKMGEAAVDPVREALKDGHPAVRAKAAAVLGDLGFQDRAIVVALARCLRDSDSSVRIQSANALLKLAPEPRVVLTEVRLAAQDRDRDVRFAAMRYLSGLGSPALPLLLTALRDEDPAVQAAAVEALTQLTADNDLLSRVLVPLSSEEKNVSVRKNALKVLRRCGPSALPHFVAALKDREPAVREEAILILRDFKGDPKQLKAALLDALKDDDANIRAGALLTLVRFGNEALPHLRAAMGDGSPAVRRSAATGLSRFDVTVAPLLIAALKDDDKEVREAALRSLLDLRAEDKALLPLMAEALKDQDKTVRQGAAYVMKRFKEAGITYLLPLVDDPESDVQYAAVYAIDDIGGGAEKSFPVLEKVVRGTGPAKLRQMAMKAMLAVNQLDNFQDDPPKAVPALIALLEGPKAAKRWEAAMTLAAIGPGARSAVPALTQARKDGDPNLSKAAQHALEQIEKK
jgi:HEAT repeat protein